MTKTLARYLIVRADGQMRVVTQARSPRLNFDEVGFRLLVTVPTAWGEVAPETIKVTVPEGAVRIEVLGEAELLPSNAKADGEHD